MNSADAFIRIEKGSADPDELAALTVVLLARAAELSAAEGDRGPGGTGGAGRAPVRWRRRERRAGHRTAPGWRAGGPAHGAGAAT
ncbi:acyl-CoA carboxylase subunit epsilon [Streptomyces sp. NPDC058701]|uniref:acyl-CoA carboxylase subunit epsilon n=1 Tax=Streptomyces sp. NPDC058701 TaxID=3346608 RepID=UPI00366516FF